MKRALVVAVAAASMLLGGAGIATANGHGGGPPFGPGSINPDHPAWYGLCTAYYNNSDEGKQNGAPFQALEEHFDENDDGELSDAERQALDDFCGSRTPGNSGNSNAPAPGPRR